MTNASSFHFLETSTQLSSYFLEFIHSLPSIPCTVCINLFIPSFIRNKLRNINKKEYGNKNSALSRRPVQNRLGIAKANADKITNSNPHHLQETMKGTKEVSNAIKKVNPSSNTRESEAC